VLNIRNTAKKNKREKRNTEGHLNPATTPDRGGLLRKCGNRLNLNREFDVRSV